MTTVLSHADLLLFTATANLSIVSLNLSLMLNRVGFYQARCSLLHALSLSQVFKHTDGEHLLMGLPPYKEPLMADGPY